MDGLSRIFQLVRPFWRRIVLAALCSSIVAAFNGAFAWIVKFVVDVVLVNGEKTALLSLVIVSIFAMRGLFSFMQNYLMNSVGAKIVRDIRNTLFEHMAYLPMSYFSADSTGSMISRVLNDAELLQHFLAIRVRDLFVSVGTIVVLTGVAFYRRWDLALLALVALPFAFYSAGRLGRRLKLVARHAQEKISLVTESLSESLLGIKIIKAFSAEKVEATRIAVMNQSYYRELMRITRIEGATGLIMEVFSGIGVGMIIYYGGTLVARGEITTGDFFSFMVAILMVYTPAKRLTLVYNGLQRAKALVARFDEILDMQKESDGTNNLRPIQKEIEFRSVSVLYPGRTEFALSDVSITVRKGSMLAIVGRSGSGKTTLANLLPRFMLPTSGAVYIDGADIAGATLRSLRSQIGIVSQDVFLFNDTVRANIAYGREDVADAEVEAAARAADAHGFISAFPEGYGTQIGQGGVMVSGGQRQRISIARALLKDPPILVLDEATSSLDTQSEMLVQQALDRLMDSTMDDSSSRTTIVIAHRLSTIKRADVILILDGGKVVEAGSHAELMASGGLYSKLYSLQSGGAEYLDIDATAL